MTLPTDIKSVSYFVSFDTPGDVFNGGLFRREVDRSSLRQAGTESAFQVDAAAREIAPEVVEIGFRYFDGESWLSEWDSDTEGGFPVAVEFVMILDPARLRGFSDRPYEYAGFNAESMRVFRCVTHLPVAEILSQEEQDLAQDRSGGLGGAQDSGGTGDPSSAGGEGQGGENQQSGDNSAGGQPDPNAAGDPNMAGDASGGPPSGPPSGRGQRGQDSGDGPGRTGAGRGGRGETGAGRGGRDGSGAGRGGRGGSGTGPGRTNGGGPGGNPATPPTNAGSNDRGGSP
jgi:hypothetical protein